MQLLEHGVYRDDRGFFFKRWNSRQFEELRGVNTTFVQDNQSGSARRVLRGLYYQLPPHLQEKLVRAIVGSVFDVAIDIRRPIVIREVIRSRTDRHQRSATLDPTRATISHEVTCSRIIWVATVKRRLGL